MAAEVAANPAADIADIGDMPGGRQNTNQTQIHRKRANTKYKIQKANTLNIETWHGGHAHRSLSDRSLAGVHGDWHPKVGREARHA